MVEQGRSKLCSPGYPVVVLALCLSPFLLEPCPGLLCHCRCEDSTPLVGEESLHLEVHKGFPKLH